MIYIYLMIYIYTGYVYLSHCGRYLLEYVLDIMVNKRMGITVTAL